MNEIEKEAGMTPKMFDDLARVWKEKEDAHEMTKIIPRTMYRTECACGWTNLSDTIKEAIQDHATHREYCLELREAEQQKKDTETE